MIEKVSWGEELRPSTVEVVKKLNQTIDVVNVHDMSHRITDSIDIKTYTQAAPYTTPSRGYVRARSGTSAVAIHIDDYTMTTVPASHTGSLMVEKGCRVFVDNTSQAAHFLPLTAYQPTEEGE